jgi:hypothetical protein
LKPDWTNGPKLVSLYSFRPKDTDGDGRIDASEMSATVWGERPGENITYELTSKDGDGVKDDLVRIDACSTCSTYSKELVAAKNLSRIELSYLDSEGKVILTKKIQITKAGGTGVFAVKLDDPNSLGSGTLAFDEVDAKVAKISSVKLEFAFQPQVEEKQEASASVHIHKLVADQDWSLFFGGA